MSTEKQLESTAVKPEEIYQLVEAISQFNDNFGPWDYTCARCIAETVSTGKIIEIKENIQEKLDFLEQSPELIVIAKELLCRLSEIEQKLQTKTKRKAVMYSRYQK